MLLLLRERETCTLQGRCAWLDALQQLPAVSLLRLPCMTRAAVCILRGATPGLISLWMKLRECTYSMRAICKQQHRYVRAHTKTIVHVSRVCLSPLLLRG